MGMEIGKFKLAMLAFRCGVACELQQVCNPATDEATVNLIMSFRDVIKCDKFIDVVKSRFTNAAVVAKKQIIDRQEPIGIKILKTSKLCSIYFGKKHCLIMK